MTSCHPGTQMERPKRSNQLYSSYTKKHSFIPRVFPPPFLSHRFFQLVFFGCFLRVRVTESVQAEQSRKGKRRGTVVARTKTTLEGAVCGIRGPTMLAPREPQLNSQAFRLIYATETSSITSSFSLLSYLLLSLSPLAPSSRLSGNVLRQQQPSYEEN